MKINTAELTGPALDCAVARCEALGTNMLRVHGGAVFIKDCDTLIQCDFSTNWAQGGPIIERERITVRANQRNEGWEATKSWIGTGRSGPTPLIAAMRCYVASKLGDEVEIPGELA